MSWSQHKQSLPLRLRLKFLLSSGQTLLNIAANASTVLGVVGVVAPELAVVLSQAFGRTSDKATRRQGDKTTRAYMVTIGHVSKFDLEAVIVDVGLSLASQHE